MSPEVDECTPPKALVFDLWKTLVPLPESVKQDAFEAAAAALGETPQHLAPIWTATRADRETRPLSEYLRQLRQQTGRSWTDQMLDELASARVAIHGAMFARPLDGALDVLDRARSAGLPVAVISNGSSDVREMFGCSPLAGRVDHLLLSADLGVMKPSVRIFTAAAHRLGVPADACVYVGDGHDRELEGARAAGMTPVLLDLGEGRAWNGPRITSLHDLPGEVGL